MHANAKLTPAGRKVLCERVDSGRPVAHVAKEMGISRKTADKWVKRWRAEGDAGLEDRSSRPKRSPNKTRPKVERKICSLRRNRKLGPARIAGQLELSASTVHAVLVRNGLNRLAWMDRPTGQVIRRYEHDKPGDLVHMDVKKLGRIPKGGGWRAHGRAQADHHHRTKVGYAFIHSVVDDHSRVAYSEVLDNETAAATIAFFQRATAWFADHGIQIARVLTDNGSNYRSAEFARCCAELAIAHKRTRPYRPQTNGKVERFNRTLLEEWAYVRLYRSDRQRNQALVKFLHTYNHHRCHTALGGNPPMSRVTNLPARHS